MRFPRRRWVVVALLVIAADTALVLTAGLFLAASSRLHSSVTLLAAGMLNGVASIMPAGIAAGVGAILGVLGAGWWQAHLVGPALAGGTGTGAPALAGVLAVPVYAAVRRSAKGRPRPPVAPRGAPVHRVYVAKTAKVFEPGLALSTAVQEPA